MRKELVKLWGPVLFSGIIPRGSLADDPAITRIATAIVALAKFINGDERLRQRFHEYDAGEGDNGRSRAAICMVRIYDAAMHGDEGDVATLLSRFFCSITATRDGGLYGSFGEETLRIRIPLEIIKGEWRGLSQADIERELASAHPDLAPSTNLFENALLAPGQRRPVRAEGPYAFSREVEATVDSRPDITLEELPEVSAEEFGARVSPTEPGERIIAGGRVTDSERHEARPEPPLFKSVEETCAACRDLLHSLQGRQCVGSSSVAEAKRVWESAELFAIVLGARPVWMRYPDHEVLLASLRDRLKVSDVREAVAHVWARCRAGFEGKRPNGTTGDPLAYPVPDRQAAPRDHAWLAWSEREGLKPAHIRDKWNALPDEDRKIICPRWPSRVDSGDSGRETVKKAIALARRERDSSAKS